MVASAQGNWVQVGLPPNFSWGYLGQQIGSGNVSSQHAMLLDGELVTGGKLRWNRAVAEQEIRTAEQGLYAQQQRVLTDVRIGFYEALLARRNLELAQQLLTIAGDAQTDGSAPAASGRDLEGRSQSGENRGLQRRNEFVRCSAAPFRGLANVASRFGHAQHAAGRAAG